MAESPQERRLGAGELMLTHRRFDPPAVGSAESRDRGPAGSRHRERSRFELFMACLTGHLNEILLHVVRGGLPRRERCISPYQQSVDALQKSERLSRMLHREPALAAKVKSPGAQERHDLIKGFGCAVWRGCREGRGRSFGHHSIQSQGWTKEA